MSATFHSALKLLNSRTREEVASTREISFELGQTDAQLKDLAAGKVKRVEWWRFRCGENAYTFFTEHEYLAGLAKHIRLCRNCPSAVRAQQQSLLEKARKSGREPETKIPEMDIDDVFKPPQTTDATVLLPLNTVVLESEIRPVFLRSDNVTMCCFCHVRNKERMFVLCGFVLIFANIQSLYFENISKMDFCRTSFFCERGFFFG
jgi:hypothetical protein